MAIVLMLIYITIRFELTSGPAAVTCLIHDLLIMLSVYVWFQIPLDTGFIAAALTILGYSINASIIVFDRIRENLRVARKEPFEEVAERSVWQTMGRTINTTLTTLFTVGMIFVLGVPSLKQFTLPLIVGIVAGARSSIMLSASFWSFYRKHFRKETYLNKGKEARTARNNGRGGAACIPVRFFEKEGPHASGHFDCVLLSAAGRGDTAHPAGLGVHAVEVFFNTESEFSPRFL